MKRLSQTARFAAAGLTAALIAATSASAQSFTNNDPVLRNIWRMGMEQSQVYRLAQALTDSVGPRLTGSPGQDAGHDWAVRTYASMGIEARSEQYGTYLGWRRGISHVDLIAPRERALEGMMLAWSGGTGGRPVEAEVVVMPLFQNSAEVDRWLGTVAGKFVAISYAEPTCRTDDQWREYSRSGDFEAMNEIRQAERQAWNQARQIAGPGQRDIHEKLEAAGAAGIMEMRWSNVPGTNKVFRAYTQSIPAMDVSCEDYGLLFRLAANGQAPRLRVTADAEFLGEVPVFNTIATIPGSELPNEYIVLSAHFDSWDGGSGATDNATGTVTMMEAMRLLRQAYPNPRRTIIAGHWSGEEQGLNGSRSFAMDHPEIVEGLQVLLNQDNGTGRVQNISMQGLQNAGSSFARWLAQVPSEISGDIDLQIPGSPGSGGSDYAAFICYGAPAFSLSSLSWGYGAYTWHTQRDTFDKIVIGEVANNATLTAMLAYLASEDPERVSREQRSVLPGRGGQPGAWPTCRDGTRSYGN